MAQPPLASPIPSGDEWEIRLWFAFGKGNGDSSRTGYPMATSVIPESTMNRPTVTRRAFLQTSALAGFGTLFAGRLAGADADLRFGLVADVQYCDKPEAGTRFYRQSRDKLAACVEAFNAQELDFVMHLGDLIDRSFASYADVLPIYQRLQAPGYFVLGNHDFAVTDAEKAKVPETLGMKARYYDFTVKGWRFVALDGNDVGLLATVKGSPERAEAEKTLADLKARQILCAMPYNGALSARQLAWLDETLADADAKQQPAVVFCHFPVLPASVLTLWNSAEVIAVLEKHPSVVAYINGHDHAGNYAVRNGIPYLTVNGMVETADTTAYGTGSQGGSRDFDVAGTGRLTSRPLARVQ